MNAKKVLSDTNICLLDNNTHLFIKKDIFMIEIYLQKSL